MGHSVAGGGVRAEQRGMSGAAGRAMPGGRGRAAGGTLAAPQSPIQRDGNLSRYNEVTGATDPAAKGAAGSIAWGIGTGDPALLF